MFDILQYILGAVIVGWAFYALGRSIFRQSKDGKCDGCSCSRGTTRFQHPGKINSPRTNKDL